MFKAVFFLVASAWIFYVSWPALRNPRAHGFYRFFAFESLLFLVLLNLDVWFREPFSPSQIASWLLLLSSILLAVHGFYLLRAAGEPQGQFEATTRLVRSGAYRYIRHPLYCSLLLAGVGAFLKDPSLAGSALCLGLLAFLIATARVEEGEMLGRFGDEYAEYMKETRMFIPFIL